MKRLALGKKHSEKKGSSLICVSLPLFFFSNIDKMSVLHALNCFSSKPDIGISVMILFYCYLFIFFSPFFADSYILWNVVAVGWATPSNVL